MNLLIKETKMQENMKVFSQSPAPFGQIFAIVVIAFLCHTRYQFRANDDRL
jgi:hypothetical protein